MAKSCTIEKMKEEDDDFDFSDMNEMDEMYNDDMVNNMLGHLIGASTHQLNASLELTKLVVEKSATSGMSEENILATFNRVSKTIAENFPLKQLLEKFGNEI